MDNKAILRDRIRGSLMAGAAGDALGYTVEFMSLDEIRRRYGQKGITRFELINGKALISDDTQMTLFTANGILMGVTRGAMRGIFGSFEDYVGEAYKDWYYTQTGIKSKFSKDTWHATWLRDLPEMAHRRAPGNTCLSACDAMLNHREVSNDSCGCGGIMRVAPMPLFIAAHGYMSMEITDKTTAEIARITHKHPFGFLPAAMLSHLILSVMDKSVDEVRRDITALALQSAEAVSNLYPNEFVAEKLFLIKLTQKAITLAANDCSDTDNIRKLGEGWTGHEAWAIAVYCAIRHIDNPAQAIIAAVNHDGDSDSTGSICGNIVGAIYGYDMLKRHRTFCPDGAELEQTLELSNIILALADDLASGCIISEYSEMNTPAKQQWYLRYCKMQPVGIGAPTYSRPFAPDKVDSLRANEIFVFGSNLQGMHGGGAARAAHQRFGAIMGVGVGLQGQSYAIPTMQGGVGTIRPYVDQFIDFARNRPDLTFLVTRIGCGIAGFTDADIAPLFRAALPVANILLPRSFVEILCK